MTLAEALKEQSLEETKDLIEQDIDTLLEIEFLVKVFNDGVIGRYQKKYLVIVKRIIDNVKQFNHTDNRYYLSTLAKVVAISKGLNIQFQ